MAHSRVEGPKKTGELAQFESVPLLGVSQNV